VIEFDGHGRSDIFRSHEKTSHDLVIVVEYFGGPSKQDHTADFRGKAKRYRDGGYFGENLFGVGGRLRSVFPVTKPDALTGRREFKTVNPGAC
jgi:hypothetical protein